VIIYIYICWVVRCVSGGCLWVCVKCINLHKHALATRRKLDQFEHSKSMKPSQRHLEHFKSSLQLFH
jgi:hypothetical protein